MQQSLRLRLRFNRMHAEVLAESESKRLSFKEVKLEVQLH